MNHTLRIPFGLLDGVLVEPHGVANGKACGCICPGCRRPLIAYNQGRIRTTHYFGHRPDEQCTTGLETALHLAAKQALKDAQRMALPAVNDSAGGSHRVTEGAAPVARYIQVDVEPAYVLEESLSAAAPAPAPLVPEQRDFFAKEDASPLGPESAAGPGQAPVALPRYRADARGVRPDGTIDWIEVRVTNEVSPEKRRWLETQRARVVEVDLRPLLRAQVSLADVHRAVVDGISNKQWLSHPALAAQPSPVLPQRPTRPVPSAPPVLGPVPTRSHSSDARWQIQPRKLTSDGSETEHAQILRDPRVLTSAEWEAELRPRLRLDPDDRWPRYLDLNIVDDVGCDFPARIWLSLMFLDWFTGGARHEKVLLQDLEQSIYDRFRPGSKAQRVRLHKVLQERVLPYWDRCDIIRYVNGAALLRAPRSSVSDA